MVSGALSGGLGAAVGARGRAGMGGGGMGAFGPAAEKSARGVQFSPFSF